MQSSMKGLNLKRKPYLFLCNKYTVKQQFGSKPFMHQTSEQKGRKAGVVSKNGLEVDFK